MNSGVYPRIYKPKTESILFVIALCFILLGAWTQFLLQRHQLLNTFSSNFLLVVLVFALTIFVCFRLIIKTVGYKVTLLSDAIEVTTLLGTKTMRRTDISTYSFHVGGRGSQNFVSLISKNVTKPSHSLIEDTVVKLNVSLMFERDEEFDSWIMSFPCEIGATPLPKRH